VDSALSLGRRSLVLILSNGSKGATQTVTTIAPDCDIKGAAPINYWLFL